jgi:hypothetical protein
VQQVGTSKIIPNKLHKDPARFSAGVATSRIPPVASRSTTIEGWFAQKQDSAEEEFVGVSV